MEPMDALAQTRYQTTPVWKKVRVQGDLELYRYELRNKVGQAGISEAEAFQNEPTALGQNFPNPFSDETTIPFTLARGGEVTLRIYNLLGQPVAQLHDGYLQPTRYEFKWNARSMRPGIYFCELTTPEGVFSKKMTLSR